MYHSQEIISISKSFKSTLQFPNFDMYIHFGVFPRRGLDVAELPSGPRLCGFLHEVDIKSPLVYKAAQFAETIIPKLASPPHLRSFRRIGLD